MAHNLPNGVPPQMNPRIDKPINSQFNGVHSSQSSRNSSPLTTYSGQIPSSQLPPSLSRQSIPSSQLPPSTTHSPINNLQQKMGQLNIVNTTPNKSFGTSTPNQSLQQPNSGLVNSAFSPINPVKVGNMNNNSSNSAVNQATGNLVVPPPPPSTTASATNSIQQPAPTQPPPQQQQQMQKQQVINNQFNYGQSNHLAPTQTLVNNRVSPSLQAKPQQPPSANNAQNYFNAPSSTMPNQQLKAMPQQNQQQPPTNSSNRPPVTFGGPMPPHQPALQPNRPSPMTNVPLQPNQMPNLMNNQQPNFGGPPQQFKSQPVPTMPQQQQYGPPRPPNPPFPQQQQFNQNAAQIQPISQQQQQPQPQYKANLHSNRYPQGMPPQQQPPVQPPTNNYYQQQQQQQPQHYPQQQVSSPFNQYGPQAGVVQSGFNRLWGHEHFDLLQNPNVLPKEKLQAPIIHLGNEALDIANAGSEVFRCTITKIPESNSLLQKSRLPLGILIHPFKDLTHLPVIQCNVIVRCRTCRTYINPFVMFVDTKRWKCNLCYRINELPEEFQYDPVSKTYGDPSRRPEIKSGTIEYIAPAEYMLRPPQPAVYLYLFDISRLAVESGYLQSVCGVLLEELENLPGDARTQLGIICYDSALHFYSLAEGLNQPHEMTVLDIDDIFLPCPDNLLVNLKDRMDLLKDLLTQLPNRYNNTYDNNSALGAALQAAHKMMSATGGRVTVFQASLPNVGPGALTAREDPSQRAATDVAHLNPANDFYKRLALECSGQQIAVDLFIVNSQYVDIATISGISRFSGGCIHHFPLFKASRVLQNERLERSFRRYLIRKIGFEAVMRIRCTRGLSIHTFHGNFFVRSTDLLSLPNVNPDAGFGMQVSIDENLSDIQSVCFQAALLYTSSKGERRIRVHTLCLPICSTLSDVINAADQQCIVGLLGKMAVDRSMMSNLSDAREAFINVAIDVLSSYKLSLNMGSGMSGLLAPDCLRMLPLYISALLKYTSFRTGTSTRLDDRVKAMIDMKTKPIGQLIQAIYPDLYPVHNLEEQPLILNSEEQQVHQPPHLQLTARCLDSKGVYLMDMGEHMIMLVCPGVSQVFLNQVLGVGDYTAISDEMYEMPILDNLNNQRLHQFISYLNDEKPFAATLQIIRDNSPSRVEFYERLIEDRVENALSYHEFLQHLKTQVK